MRGKQVKSALRVQVQESSHQNAFVSECRVETMEGVFHKAGGCVCLQRAPIFEKSGE